MISVLNALFKYNGFVATGLRLYFGIFNSDCLLDSLLKFYECIERLIREATATSKILGKIQFECYTLTTSFAANALTTGIDPKHVV